MMLIMTPIIIWYVTICGFLLTHTATSSSSSPSISLSSRSLAAKYVPNLPQSQIAALHSLYTATNGDRWIWLERPSTQTLSVPWNFSEPDPNPCIQRWQGVLCNTNCTVASKPSPYIFCTVIGLELDSHNLDGTLPNGLVNLTSLLYLSLADNRIRGPLSGFFANMTTLVSLDLSGNVQLDGSIPDMFQMLQWLQILDLSRSRLTGTIPESIYSMEWSLEYLDVGNNRLSGSISEGLCKLENVEYVFMELNGLTGSIPPCIGNMSQVYTLMLANNSLSHSIPDTLERLSRIVTLDLSFNSLVSTIPSVINELFTLRNLQLQFNALTGTVPMLSNLENLRVLTLYVNHFVGLAPNVTAPLSLYQINYNHFSGPVYSLNTTNLIALTVQGNHLTGKIPPFVNGSRSLVSSELKNDLLQLEPIVDSTQFFQRLSKINVTTNMLFYVNFSDNHFTGSLPTWIFTSPILTYVYMFANELTGQIPDIPTNITWIGVLYLDNNKLTGSIPQTILKQRYLVNLRLAANELTGTVSAEIFDNIYMIECAVENNKFTGPLPSVKGKNLSNMGILSFSNNEFTGELSADFFNLPQLSVFAASSNCLSGAIPENVCNAEYLNALILDGMSSAPRCRTPIFPLIPTLDSFILDHGMEGNIPTCIFGLPYLESLYLSGNEFTGSISNSLNISTSLTNLRLSYNRITGTIPDVIQSRSWNILDLSFNKLSGHLFEDFNPDTNSSSSSNRTLYLDVNRLSGIIPSSTKDVSHISILNGNIFYCDFSRKALPNRDPKFHSYSCGSNSMNQALFGWLIVLFIFIVGFLVLKWKLRDVYEKFLMPLQNKVREWNRCFEIADSKVADDKLSFTFAWRFLHDLRKYCVGIACALVVLLMPLYRVLNIFQSTFEEKYAWEYSAIYVSGFTSGSILLIIFATVIALLYYWLDMKLLHLAPSGGLNFLRASTMYQDQKEVESNSSSSMLASGESNSEEVSSKQTGFTKFTFRRRQFLILLFVGWFNVISMTLVNISYVIIIVYVKNQYLIIFAQLCLAVLKLWWNDYVLWQLLRGTKRLIHSRLIKDKRLVDEIVLRLSSQDVFLVVCALLFNNVIAPCLSIAIVSPACFYNALVAAAPLTATYRYCSTYILLTRHEGACLVSIDGQTTFTPPFIYSYNCSSLLPVNYTAVYIYMALMSGFVTPTFKIIVKYYYDRMDETTWLYKLVNKYLPAVFRKLQPNPALLRKGKNTSQDTTEFDPNKTIEFNLKLRAIKPIFDKNRLVVRVVGFLALMCSFGVVYPPLAAIICLSICSFTYFEQLNIGRVLHESEALGFHWYRQKLGYDLEGIVDAFIPAILPMTFVASLLFACLIFDTFGDRHGHKIAIVPTVLMVLVPGAIWLAVRIDWKAIKAKLSGTKQVSRERPNSIAVELKENVANPIFHESSLEHQ